VAAVELVGGFQHVDELIRVKHPSLGPALDRLVNAAPACDVGVNPTVVFGDVKDLGKRPERLVD
jgi:hypothetical protein